MKIDISVNDFIDVLQSSQGNEMLNNKKIELAKKKYDDRVNSLYGAKDNSNEFYKDIHKMSKEEFENLRKNEIAQLYNAYVTYNCGVLPWLKGDVTSIDNVRNVVGVDRADWR